MITNPITIAPDGIQQVLLTHYRDIHGYVARRFPKKLQSLVDTNDIVQDVCIEAIHSYETSRPSNHQGWLLSIAKNQMLQIARRHRTLKRGAGRVIGEDALTGADQKTVIMLQDLVVYRRTPSASAIRRELIIALERALKAISESHRNVVNMRYIDGLSAAQAASQLGISEDAIRQLARRALAAIRIELDSYVPNISWTT